MSRVGKKEIVLPAGVTAEMADRTVTVRGPRGELTYTVHPAVGVEIAADKILCQPAGEAKEVKALWGTTRARLNNLVRGVTEGFRRELELVGVGYRAQLKGQDLELAVGYSHPVLIKAPDGITFAVEKELITVEGNDIAQVGQIAADIRAVRKPEPYKGKGIRYRGEVVRRKVGKVAGTAE
jgi:large subunit ribosomal protein L6